MGVLILPGSVDMAGQKKIKEEGVFCVNFHIWTFGVHVRLYNGEFNLSILCFHFFWQF